MSEGQEDDDLHEGAGEGHGPLPAPVELNANVQDLVAALGIMWNRGSDRDDDAKGKGRGVPWTPRAPTITDYKREFNYMKFPSYDMNVKTLRRYKQDVALMLATCSPGAHKHVVPHLITQATSEFRNRWLKGNYKMEDFEGDNGLSLFYLELKKIAGTVPVDDLFDSTTFYLNVFRQTSTETVKEYIDREANQWEQFQESVSAIQAVSSRPEDNIGSEAIAPERIEPIHDQLRGMLLLKRSVVAPRDYPMLTKECRGHGYKGIKDALLNCYQECRSLRGNQGSFVRHDPKPSRPYNSGRKPLRRPYHKSYAADYEWEDWDQDFEDPPDYSSSTWWKDDNDDEDDDDDGAAYGASCQNQDVADHDDFEFQTIPPEGVLDDEGHWWTSSPAALDEQDANLADQYPSYASALLSFTQAKEVLRNARVAREFYPVVVPVSAFVKTKGKGKGRGKKTRGNARANQRASEAGRESPKVAAPRAESQVGNSPTKVAEPFLVKARVLAIELEQPRIRNSPHLLPWMIQPQTRSVESSRAIAVESLVTCPRHALKPPRHSSAHVKMLVMSPTSGTMKTRMMTWIGMMMTVNRKKKKKNGLTMMMTITDKPGSSWKKQHSSLLTKTHFIVAVLLSTRVAPVAFLPCLRLIYFRLTDLPRNPKDSSTT